MELCRNCSTYNLVVGNEDGDYCDLCGYLRVLPAPLSSRDSSAAPAKDHEPSASEKKTPTPSPARAWLRQHARTLGGACLLRASRILDRLGPPFMREFPEHEQIAGERLPWFSFNPDFTEETQEILRRLPPATIESSDEWMWRQWQLGKKEEITAVLNRLPDPERRQVRKRWNRLITMRERKLLDHLPNPARDAVAEILRLCSKDMRTKFMLLDC